MPDNPLWMFRPFLSPAPLPLEVISQLQEPMKALQMWLFFSLLLVGAIFDCQKRLIPNTICALITIVGLLVFHPAQLMGPLAALPLLAAAMHKPGSIGGGDIKFTAASGFVLGITAGSWGMALGLTLAALFYAAGMGMTPEVYSSFAILKAAVILLGVIPCLLVLPLLAPVILFLGIAVYFKEIRRADERLSEKRGEVEAELPRFVATITQELAASRDVLSMVESYKRNAGPTFAAELDILTADMRSGSYEAALTRFEARFNSPLLSDVIRGLIGVLRGDNGVAYFQMLSHDMKQLELQRLKAQAMKIPPKIRVFSFLMLMCFLMTYLAIIVYEIITSLGGMF